VFTDELESEKLVALPMRLETATVNFSESNVLVQSASGDLLALNVGVQVNAGAANAIEVSPTINVQPLNLSISVNPLG